MLSTIDAENKRKQPRQKNAIIFCLPTSSQQPDTELAQQLIGHELHFVSSILSCQRLGKPSSSKIQPIKLSLSSQQEAEVILVLAKQLQSSIDNNIIKHIFVNKDLTKS
jgi:hypothetical protein